MYYLNVYLSIVLYVPATKLRLNNKVSLSTSNCSQLTTYMENLYQLSSGRTNLLLVPNKALKIFFID